MMKERKLTINIVWANVFGIILLVAVVVLTMLLWKRVWGEPTLFPEVPAGMSADELDAWLIAYLLKLTLLLVVFLGGIVVHELIHGITWACFARNGWKSISFGVMWKMLTPYCHCSEPLRVRGYIVGALMPLVVLGILPWIIGFGIGNFLTTIFGVAYITAAGGDILVAWKLRHEHPASSVLDHPTEAGCIIYEEE